MPAVKSSFFLGLCGVGVALFCLPPTIAQAQLQLPATVRLPVFKSFYYQGSVRVPDGGTLNLGGSTRSYGASGGRGVPGLSNAPVVGRGFGNRGLAAGQQVEKAGVKADVLMLEELEADHLSRAGLSARLSQDDILKQAAFLTKHVGRNAQTPKPSRNSEPGRK